jgi:hypothetical protein
MPIIAPLLLSVVDKKRVKRRLNHRYSVYPIKVLDKFIESET